jgi:hypothetical protein
MHSWSYSGHLQQIWHLHHGTLFALASGGGLFFHTLSPDFSKSLTDALPLENKSTMQSGLGEPFLLLHVLVGVSLIAWQYMDWWGSTVAFLKPLKTSVWSDRPSGHHSPPRRPAALSPADLF